MEIEWMDELPKSVKGGSRSEAYGDILDMVAENPGKWGKVVSYKKGEKGANSLSALGSQISKRGIKGQKDGIWDAATRTDGDDNVSLYVRFTANEVTPGE